MLVPRELIALGRGFSDRRTEHGQASPTLHRIKMRWILSKTRQKVTDRQVLL
jgi:hypothetical protein